MPALPLTEACFRGAGAVTGRSPSGVEAWEESLGNPPGSDGMEGMESDGGMGGTGGMPPAFDCPSVRTKADARGFPLRLLAASILLRRQTVVCSKLRRRRIRMRNSH